MYFLFGKYFCKMLAMFLPFHFHVPKKIKLLNADNTFIISKYKYILVKSY